MLVKFERVPHKKIVVINHGLDLDYFRRPDPEKVAELRERYRTGGHFPVVGVISSFVELKGIQFIIPAFRRLLSDYPQAKILFFNATGKYNSEINRMLERIHSESYCLIPFENALNAAYRAHGYLHTGIDGRHH